MRKQGYAVREARDGAEAIELIDNSQFDLVLSDIRMPRVDGVALATNILSRVPTIPIILMTAVPFELTRSLGYNVPCLSKPICLMNYGRVFRRRLLGEKIYPEPRQRTATEEHYKGHTIRVTTGHPDKNRWKPICKIKSTHGSRELIKDLDWDLSYDTPEEAERVGLLVSKKWIDSGKPK